MDSTKTKISEDSDNSVSSAELAKLKQLQFSVDEEDDPAPENNNNEQM